MALEVKKRKKRGFAFHVHHDLLFEYCHDLEGRVGVIKQTKLVCEHELRLRLLKMIPRSRVPKEFIEAQKAYNLTNDAYEEAQRKIHKRGLVAQVQFDELNEARTKAGDEFEAAITNLDEAADKYRSYMEELHKELCPDCPWDGRTIFSKTVEWRVSAL